MNKILAIGDIHLGTRPGRVPDVIAEAGIEISSITPAAALERAVAFAINEGVSAVLFAGDVVESTNHRFEAIRHLETAVSNLTEAEIPVFGVAGNHDVEALPRLAQRIEGFTLVGQGGKWQSILVSTNDKPLFELVGWSFPERKVRSSPVAEFLRDPIQRPPDGVPRVGLLHADLDASGGNYAPVRRQELQDCGFDAWLLGHIHKPSLGAPSLSKEGNPIGYLGSLVGLDPTETGLRGPWLIEIKDNGKIEPHHIDISPLRWEQIDMHLDDTGDPEDLGDQLMDAVETKARELQESGSSPSVLAVRVQIVGTTNNHEAIEKWLTKENWRDAVRIVGETAVFIDKVSLELTPALDIDELAKGNDPASLLAKRLLILENGGDEAGDLLNSVRASASQTANYAQWGPLSEARFAKDPLSDEVLISTIKRAGIDVLHKMLENKPVESDENE